MTEDKNGTRDQTRDERGKYITEYDDEDFLAAVEAQGHASTKGVSDRVGCTRDYALKRLKALDKAGEVESTDLGNNMMWTIPTEQ